MSFFAGSYRELPSILKNELKVCSSFLSNDIWPKFSYGETPPDTPYICYTHAATRMFLLLLSLHKQFPLPSTKKNTNKQTNKQINKQTNKQQKLLDTPISPVIHKVKKKTTCNDCSQTHSSSLVNVFRKREGEGEKRVTWMREAITCLISMRESFQRCCCLSRSTPISCTTCDGVGV